MLVLDSDSTAPPIYKFGVFEANTARGELLRKGMKIRLQEQPFRLLTALLETPGDLVSKEQLRERLWPGNTYVETDVSLSVAVGKLREALGDDATSPRFVETVPRRGYRFLAPVQKLHPSPPVVPLVTVPAAINDTNSSVLAPARGATLRKWSIALLALAVVAAASIYYWFTSRSRPAASVHSVVISDFTNSTGDPVFDASLRRALTLQLAQSPAFLVHSDAAIDEALQGLGRPPSLDHVTPEIARQVCLPLGADVTLTGSVSRAGYDHFSILVEADRCGDGSHLVQASKNVVGRDRVLPAVGQLLVNIRRHLGESNSSLRRFNVPIQQASTDSLDALNAYRVGLDLRSRGKHPDSIPFFKAAILLDTQFAMAYEQAGSVLYNLGEQELGARYLQKAFDLRARVTEPERFFITGRYFDIVTGQLEKALAVYSLWQKTYPLDWLPFNESANDEKLIGRYAEGIRDAREAMRLEPNHSFSYANLAISLFGAQRTSEADAICREAMRKRRDSSELHRTIYELAFLSGDLERVAKAAPLIENDIDVSASAAMAAASRGKIADAGRLLVSNAAKARSAGFPGAAAYPLGLEALLLADVGQTAEARHFAELALAAKGGTTGFGLALVALAVAGDKTKSEEAGREYDRAYPLSLYNMGVYGPSAKTALASAQSATPEQVKEMMAPALPYELGREANLLPVYVRATSLLKAGDGPDAVYEFHKLLDHREVNPVSPYLSLAHLGLARSFKLTHQHADSCTEYGEFLRLWQNGDRGVPAHQAAQREYDAAHCGSPE